MVFILRRYSATERREPGRSGYNIVGLSLHSLHVAAAAAAAAISGGWLHWRRGCKSSSRQQSRRPPISSTAGRTRAQPARPGGSTSLLSAAPIANTAATTCLGVRFLNYSPLSHRMGVTPTLCWLPFEIEFPIEGRSRSLSCSLSLFTVFPGNSVVTRSSEEPPTTREETEPAIQPSCRRCG